MIILSIVTITRNSPSLLRQTLTSYPNSSLVEGLVIDASTGDSLQENIQSCHQHNNLHHLYP